MTLGQPLPTAENTALSEPSSWATEVVRRASPALAPVRQDEHYCRGEAVPLLDSAVAGLEKETHARPSVTYSSP